MRLDPAVYERAAEYVDRQLIGCCTALDLSDHERFVEYRDAFAAVFKPTKVAKQDYWWGAPWWLVDGHRDRTPRVLALLLMAEVIRTGDAP